MCDPTAPRSGAYPVPLDVARSRVVIPSPVEPAFRLVLTCGGRACRHVFEPDPVAFAAARLRCPSCGGWAFVAELVEPSSAGTGAGR